MKPTTRSGLINSADRSSIKRNELCHELRLGRVLRLLDRKTGAASEYSRTINNEHKPVTHKLHSLRKGQYARVRRVVHKGQGRETRTPNLSDPTGARYQRRPRPRSSKQTVSRRTGSLGGFRSSLSAAWASAPGEIGQNPSSRLPVGILADEYLEARFFIECLSGMTTISSSDTQAIAANECLKLSRKVHL